MKKLSIVIMHALFALGAETHLQAMWGKAKTAEPVAPKESIESRPNTPEPITAELAAEKFKIAEQKKQAEQKTTDLAAATKTAADNLNADLFKKQPKTTSSSSWWDTNSTKATHDAQRTANELANQAESAAKGELGAPSISEITENVINRADREKNLTEQDKNVIKNEAMKAENTSWFKNWSFTEFTTWIQKIFDSINIFKSKTVQRQDNPLNQSIDFSKQNLENAQSESATSSPTSQPALISALENNLPKAINAEAESKLLLKNAEDNLKLIKRQNENSAQQNTWRYQLFGY